MSALATNLLSAERELSAIERQQYEELEAARIKIETSFHEPIHAAKKRVNAAKKELQDHAIANAAHPLLGKKVTRTIRELHRYSMVKYTDTQIFGLCEVFTFSMPRRSGYCHHSPGDIVVRVLKKDGTPGLTIESVKGWTEAQS